MHSASVWWLDPPSVLEFAIMLVLAVFFNLGLLAQLAMGPSPFGLIVSGFFAFGFTFGAVVAGRKLIKRSLGDTDARLHFSPRLVGLQHDGGFWWHQWSDVHVIRVCRRRFSRYWIVRIKGRRRWYLLGKRRTMIKAVARWNRREAALVRNTMHRYWSRANIMA